MNKISFVLMLGISLLGWSRVAAQQDPNFFVFLCFGQSNMEGQGTISTQDKVVDARFQVLQSVDCDNLDRDKDQWYPAVPPLTRCWNGLGPSDYFGRTLVSNLPKQIKVGVINVSIGGCNIGLFDKEDYVDHLNTYTEDWFQNAIDAYDRNPYQFLVNQAKKAQAIGVIKGFLLHQGETNNGDTQWPAKVKKIYDHLIEDLGLDPEQTPLLAGELVHEDQNGALAGMNTIINQLPDVLPNSFVISSSGCTAKDDNIHFDAAGYRTLGARYGETMLSLLEYDTTYVLSTLPDYDRISIAPNPVMDEATISFSLNKKSKVKVVLYDMAGQQITTITNEKYKAGEHDITHSFVQYPKGVYLYNLQVGADSISRRVIVR